MRTVSLTSLVLLAACAEPSPPVQPSPRPSGLDFADGTRLVARHFTAPGAPAAMVEIFDRQEQVVCTFRLAGDGKLRCLPWESIGWWSHYADPECKRQLYGRETCGGGPRYVTLARDPMVCGTAWPNDVFPLVPVAASAPRYVRPDGQGCVVERDPEPHDELVPGEALPPTTWVEGTETLLGDRLAVRRIRSADGGWFDVGLVDRTTARSCSPWLGEAGTGECSPPLLLSGGFYGDPDCTVPLAVAGAGQCAPTALVLQGGDLRAVGPVWTGDLYFGSTGAACTKNQAPPDWRLYTFGEVVARGDSPAIALRLRGEGRLALRVSEDEAGRPIPRASWNGARYHDRQLGRDCNPTPTSAGLRCVPVDVAGDDGRFFADPACTQPVVECRGGCKAQVARFERTACGTTATNLYGLGAPLPGYDAYVLDERAPGGPTCRFQSGAKGHPTYVRLGEPQSWEQFAVLEEKGGP